jgi:serine protease Do
MNDSLRTKLNLMLTAIVAFAIGLGIAARLDLIQPGMARHADNPPLELKVAPPAPVQNDALPLAGFSDIAERVTPAVVTIFVERTIEAHARGSLPPAFDDFFRQQPPQRVAGSGSGFIVSDDGYVVTNNHVVEEADQITVQLSDRREFSAELIGRDPTTDVALLKLVGADNLTPVTLGSSDATRVGEWVLAIGSPGFRGVGAGPLTTTVTAGIVSAKGRSINIIGQELPDNGQGNLAIEDFIQTDAAINPGNSGGPLVNIRGEVIGINSAIASETGTNQGYGFAVPIDLVQEVVDDLVQYGEVRRALLGVSIQPVDDTDARYYGLSEVAGAKVMGVTDGMSAADAGIHTGDVIVAVNGDQVESVPDLQRKIRSHDPGETVDVTVIRSDDLKKETIPVRLADAGDLRRDEQPRVVEAESSDPLGVEVEDLNAEIRRALDLPRDLEGVVVVSFDQYGLYARRAGRALPGNAIRGSVITSIDRKQIRDMDDYRAAVKDLKPGEVVGLEVYNPQSGSEVPITVALPN